MRLRGVLLTCDQHAKHVSQGNQPTRSHEQATGRTANSECSTKRAPKEPAHDFNALFQEDLRRGRKRPLAHSVITLSDSAEPPQRQFKYGAILSEWFGTSISRST